MTPSTLLFFSTLFMGTMISLSSTNWLYLWMGMELNLLSFIPLLASSQSMQETEASVKYFIIQAIGSGLMLVSGIMSTNPAYASNLSAPISLTFITSMTIKLGMAPCHQWLPHVMSSIPWLHCLILATWQKAGPLIMLMFIMPQSLSPMVLAIATLSTLVGGLGGLNQAQLRALLAYSSIGHMGWILMAMKCSSTLFQLYFSIYIIISLSLMCALMKIQTLFSRLPNALNLLNLSTFTMVMMIMFSLGGLPPLLGFLPKWAVIHELVNKSMLLIMMALISGSLINLFYYLNMTFNFMLASPQTPQATSAPMWMIALALFSSISPLVIIM